MQGALATKIRTLRTQVVGGRISTSPPEDGRGFNSALRSTDRIERLFLSFDDGSVTMNYEQSTPQWQLRCDVAGGNQVTIRLSSKGAEDVITPIEFQQPDEGPLVLRVGSDTNHREISAPTLWHLLVSEQKLCQQELAPLLEFLRPEWKLSETAAAAEKTLAWAAQTMQPYDRRMLSELVDELGSPRFARREAAERKLVAAGQAILPLLRGVERSRLDAEQSYRLRAIMRTLQGDGAEDTPERIATWLAGDPYVWLALLARDDEDTRREAGKQLARLLQEPIVFDPAGLSALREAQIKTISARVAKVWAF
jgi:hypothetical protein